MPAFLQQRLKFLFFDESAVTAVEYAIVLTLIAGACIVVIAGVGFASGGMWTESAADLGSKFVEAGVGK